MNRTCFSLASLISLGACCPPGHQCFSAVSLHVVPDQQMWAPGDYTVTLLDNGLLDGSCAFTVLASCEPGGCIERGTCDEGLNLGTASLNDLDGVALFFEIPGEPPELDVRLTGPELDVTQTFRLDHFPAPSASLVCSSTCSEAWSELEF